MKDLRKNIWGRALIMSALICFLFETLIPSQIFAQMAPSSLTSLGLPVPGSMVNPSPVFVPAILKGMKIYPDNPFRFDFIVDTGNTRLEGEPLKDESAKLIKYFLTSLTVPPKDLWVNLSPYEQDRIIPEKFGFTEMGRDLLAQDYLLKQLTASLIYPENELGKKFWDRVYAKAQELYGNTEIPVNTFNKVWIIPDKAVVYESGNVAFIAESHLKVMLEGDYLALVKNKDNSNMGLDKVSEPDEKKVSDVSSAIIRDVILPEIEKEVNGGENFALLRQIYHSMILAAWFKRNLRESVLGKVYTDQNKVSGIDIEDKTIKEKIYQQYLEAFKKGVYDYIKEDYDSLTQDIIPRKYFAGGFEGVQLFEAEGDVPGSVEVLQKDPADSQDMTMKSKVGNFKTVVAELKESGQDIHMISDESDLMKAVHDLLSQPRPGMSLSEGAPVAVMKKNDMSIIYILNERQRETSLGQYLQESIARVQGSFALRFNHEGIWRTILFESDFSRILQETKTVTTSGVVMRHVIVEKELGNEIIDVPADLNGSVLVKLLQENRAVRSRIRAIFDKATKDNSIEYSFLLNRKLFDPLYQGEKIVLPSGKLFLTSVLSGTRNVQGPPAMMLIEDEDSYVFHSHPHSGISSIRVSPGDLAKSNGRGQTVLSLTEDGKGLYCAYYDQDTLPYRFERVLDGRSGARIKIIVKSTGEVLGETPSVHAWGDFKKTVLRNIMENHIRLFRIDFLEGELKFQEGRYKYPVSTANADDSHMISRSGSITAFETNFKAPLLKQDPLLADEIQFLFELFAKIKVRFVSPDSLSADSIIQKISDDKNNIKEILLSESLTAENLIDVFAELRDLSPEGQYGWKPLVIRLYSLLQRWEKVLAEYSGRQDIAEDLREEIARLSEYLERLIKNMNDAFELSDFSPTVSIDEEGNIRRFLDKALEHMKSHSDRPDRLVRGLEFFLSTRFARYLTDQLDVILMEGSFDRFRQFAESWDSRSTRQELLEQMTTESQAQEFVQWIQSMKERFFVLQKQYKEDPQGFREQYIQLAREIGEKIKKEIPGYLSAGFQLDAIMAQNKANCVGFSTMFYFLAKEIGLDAGYVYVEYFNGNRDDHAANLLHLPPINGQKSFIFVDVTKQNNFSDPINEKDVTIQYQDSTVRRISIPQEKAQPAVVLEYFNGADGIKAHSYAWGYVVDRFAENDALQRQAAEKRLRFNPNDIGALERLGYYYESIDETSKQHRDVDKAIFYLKKNLRIFIKGITLKILRNLFDERGEINKFYSFCDELLKIHNSPEAYLIVARNKDPFVLIPEETQMSSIQKRIEILEEGLKKFPGDRRIIRELALSYGQLYLKDNTVPAYKMALAYSQQALAISPKDPDLLYEYLFWEGRTDPKRMVSLAQEFSQKNPELAEPILVLMIHSMAQETTEGYQEVVRLANQYLERPELELNRVRILSYLKLIYSPSDIIREQQKGNVFAGQAGEYLQYLQELSPKIPDSPALKTSISEIFAEKGNYHEAINYLKQALEIIPESVERLEILIGYQSKILDWDGVVTTAEKILEEEGRNIAGLKWKGVALQEQGKYSEAVKVFQRALALIRMFSTNVETETQEIEQRHAECQAKLAASQTGVFLTEEQQALPSKKDGFDGSMKSLKPDDVFIDQEVLQEYIQRIVRNGNSFFDVKNALLLIEKRLADHKISELGFDDLLKHLEIFMDDPGEKFFPEGPTFSPASIDLMHDLLACKKQLLRFAAARDILLSEEDKEREAVVNYLMASKDEFDDPEMRQQSQEILNHLASMFGLTQEDTNNILQKLIFIGTDQDVEPISISPDSDRVWLVDEKGLVREGDDTLGKKRIKRIEMMRVLEKQRRRYKTREYQKFDDFQEVLLKAGEIVRRYLKSPGGTVFREGGRSVIVVQKTKYTSRDDIDIVLTAELAHELHHYLLKRIGMDDEDVDPVVKEIFDTLARCIRHGEDDFSVNNLLAGKNLYRWAARVNIDDVKDRLERSGKDRKWLSEINRSHLLGLDGQAIFYQIYAAVKDAKLAQRLAQDRSAFSHQVSAYLVERMIEIAKGPQRAAVVLSLMFDENFRSWNTDYRIFMNEFSYIANHREEDINRAMSRYALVRITSPSEKKISQDLSMIKPGDEVSQPSDPQETRGGIDLNEELLNIETKGNGPKINVPLDPENILNIPIDGFTPYIFQIVPTNLPLFLGIEMKEKQPPLALVGDGRDRPLHFLEARKNF